MPEWDEGRVETTSIDDVKSRGGVGAWSSDGRHRC